MGAARPSEQCLSTLNSKPMSVILGTVRGARFEGRATGGVWRGYFAVPSVSRSSFAAGPDDAGFWPVINWPSATV